MRKKRTVITTLLVIAVIIGSFVIFFNPSTGLVLNAKLNEVSSGGYTSTHNNTTYTVSWVKLSISFSFPLELDPNRLNFYVTIENGTFPLGGNIGNSSGVNVTYHINWYPHLLATGENNNMSFISTSFFGKIVNPDGHEVGDTQLIAYRGGIPFSNGTISGDSFVQSGAIVNLTFPSSTLNGITVTMQYAGAYGSPSIVLSRYN